MMRITDVVRHLLIINVLIFFGTTIMLDKSTSFSLFAIFYPTSPFFKPHQIITHMFMHGDEFHLIFNMFAVFMFGPPIEARWGQKRFLTYYLLTGLGALGLYMFATYLEVSVFNTIDPEEIKRIPMVGASGAVFGLLTAYAMLYPNSTIQLLIPPIPLKAKYFVLIYAGIELFLGLGRFNTGIAHFAHLGGALFGFLLILYWNRRGSGSQFDRWD